MVKVNNVGEKTSVIQNKEGVSIIIDPNGNTYSGAPNFFRKEMLKDDFTVRIDKSEDSEISHIAIKKYKDGKEITISDINPNEKKTAVELAKEKLGVDVVEMVDLAKKAGVIQSKHSYHLATNPNHLLELNSHSDLYKNEIFSQNAALESLGKLAVDAFNHSNKLNKPSNNQNQHR